MGPTDLQMTRGKVLLVFHGGLGRFSGKWLVTPPIYMRGRGSNEDTHHTPHSHNTFHSLLEFLLELRIALGSLGVEVLRRGAGNDALVQ